MEIKPTLRFTKSAIIAELRQRAFELETINKFDHGNGSAQVEKSSPSRNRAYGEWKTLRDVAREIEDGYLGRGKNEDHKTTRLAV